MKPQPGILYICYRYAVLLRYDLITSPTERTKYIRWYRDHDIATEHEITVFNELQAIEPRPVVKYTEVIPILGANARKLRHNKTEVIKYANIEITNGRLWYELQLLQQRFNTADISELLTLLIQNINNEPLQEAKQMLQNTKTATKAVLTEISGLLDQTSKAIQTAKNKM